VPALALGLSFVGRQSSVLRWELAPPQLLEELVGLEVLVSYFKFFEGLLSRGFFWGLVLLAVAVLWTRWRSRQLERLDLFLAAVALALVAYFAAPSAMSGGSFVNTRLSLFVFFLLILWLGVHPFAPRPKRLVQAGAAAFALGLLGVHTLAYAKFNDYLADYASVEGKLKPDATVLPLAFSHQLRVPGLGNAKVGVFRHAAGYLAARRGVVELENYEANTNYFPVSYQSKVNPFDHIGVGGNGPDEGLQAQPPNVEFLTYPKRTGQRVDFVLLWQAPDEPQDARAAAIFRQLDEGYQAVFKSPHGLARLYRRKD
jgi:hypothetical protein